ncbi:hypothetical protein SAMN02744775_03848 [Enterobacter sp. CC120223-11]|nr:hypothetical protein SAMN02744775_03848 [Enterobacter sp. CC120223-11]
MLKALPVSGKALAVKFFVISNGFSHLQRMNP